jgi:hypothetical protein
VDSWVLGGPLQDPGRLVKQPSGGTPRQQSHYYPGPQLCRPGEHDFQQMNLRGKLCVKCGCAEPHPNYARNFAGSRGER